MVSPAVLINGLIDPEKALASPLVRRFTGESANSAAGMDMTNKASSKIVMDFFIVVLPSLSIYSVVPRLVPAKQSRYPHE
jgi:hypothetical protein